MELDTIINQVQIKILRQFLERLFVLNQELIKQKILSSQFQIINIVKSF